MNSLFTTYIPYEEIVKNWNNKDWEHWTDVLWIETQIPSRHDNQYGLDRIHDMTCNYLVEKAIKELLNASFSDNSHMTFHTGYGDKTPDFILSNGYTAELKRYELDYNDPKWWNADCHLIYKKHNLYIQHEDNNLELIYKDLYIQLI